MVEKIFLPKLALRIYRSKSETRGPGLTLWIWHPLGRLLQPASRNGRIATWPPHALDRRSLATSRSLGLAESQLALKLKQVQRVKEEYFRKEFNDN